MSSTRSTEGPFWKSLGQRIKNSSRADRFSCCACCVILLIAIGVIVYLLAFSPPEGPSIFDISPHAWMISREMWRGADMENDPVKYRPLRLVIVNHFVTPKCESFARCAESMRNLQNYFLNHKGWDLPYNFVIGNDGMVYEARGWGREGSHSYGLNTCTLGVAFIGDYRPAYGNTVLTALQVERFEKLMEYGVRKGHLDPDYVVVGASDLQESASPGDNMLKQMKTWKHYNKDRYHNMTCAQIYFQKQTR